VLDPQPAALQHDPGDQIDVAEEERAGQQTAEQPFRRSDTRIVDLRARQVAVQIKLPGPAEQRPQGVGGRAEGVRLRQPQAVQQVQSEVRRRAVVVALRQAAHLHRGRNRQPDRVGAPALDLGERAVGLGQPAQPVERVVPFDVQVEES
jgi:hypothetical protein